jgi:Ca-activated chloride channel family protein
VNRILRRALGVLLLLILPLLMLPARLAAQSGRAQSDTGQSGKTPADAAEVERPQSKAPEAFDAAETTFKVDVRLVNLLVTVKDSRGAPIADLSAEDFTVVDGGERRKIAVFERRTNRPLSVVLMLDTSLSTNKELPFERDAASRFFAKLLGEGSHPGDRVAVLQFSDYVEVLGGFTRSARSASKAMRRIQRGGGTSLYDAVYLASQQLGQREGRRVMVVITDGGDTASYMSFHEALESAHGMDAVIYAVIVIPIRADAGRNTGGENALKTLTANTGGTAFVQFGTQNLDAAFDEILESLRTQYLIGYYPPEREEGRERFRRVTVKVRRPGARVLSRNGYYLSAIPRRTSPKTRIRVRPVPRAREDDDRKPIEVRKPKKTP